MDSPQIETITLSDGYPAQAQWWQPASPRGAVLYLHGIQSHGGWYQASGAHLAAAGLTVLMPDRRGSGANQTHRGHADSAQQMLQDAGSWLDALLQRSGHSSAHLIGISWGGKLACALAAQRPQHIHSISLVAPGLYPVVDMSATDKFRVGMAMMHDRNKLFDIPLNSADLFSDVPRWIQFVEQDNLSLRQVSAGFLLASRRLDKLALQFPAPNWKGSLHLMLAGQEAIIDNQATQKWFRQRQLEDRQLTEYPQGRHTLEFLADPQCYFEDLTNWIADRCHHV